MMSARSWVVKVFSAVIGSHREVPPRKRNDILERLFFLSGRERVICRCTNAGPNISFDR